MSNSNLLLTLAKVIIAAAWADGEVQHEEVNSLKDLLFRLPEITGREWAMLEMYIESPVGVTERTRLVAQLQDALRTRADKELAVSALNDLVQADGTVTAEEKVIAKEIKAAIESADVGLFKQVGQLFRNPVNRRIQAMAGALNREDQFEDFIKNKVYYSVARRLSLGEAELDIPESDLRKLCLAGGLMAHVAHVDREVTEDEINNMVEVLQRDWDMTRETASFVAEVAVSEISTQLDYYRLTREFFSITTKDERVRFLDILFDIADADGYVSHEEIEETRVIAITLKLTHKQFIDAKLKIPRERRAN